MIGSIIFLLLLIGVLYWEYNLSRSAKLFKEWQEIEPETYNALCKNSKMYPSFIIYKIISNNQYGEIHSNKIRKELLAIDEKQAKINVLKMYVFVLYILVVLLVSVLLKS